MPVAAHALVGLTVALATQPSRRDHGTGSFGQWSLLMVTLAYVPDVVGEAGMLAGWRSTAVVSHSLLFAIVAAVAIAPLVRRSGGGGTRGFLLALFSLLAHDAMDILQSPGRAPLWPLPFRVGIGTWIPASLSGEVGVCLVPLICAAVYQYRTSPIRLGTARDWVALGALGLIGVGAVTASELRDRRERDLRRAYALAESGEYEAALEACASADKWPSPARPGRIDYVSAMAWWGLGQTTTAEQLYLRSYEADPDYIWTVADLAAMYAESDAPLAERRQRAERWLAVLNDRFSEHPARPRLIARVQRRLGQER